MDMGWMPGRPRHSFDSPNDHRSTGLCRSIGAMKRWDLRSVDVEPHQPEVLHSEGEGRTILISLPAGAGYGLPTGYFLLQGWGLIAQRTPIAGRRWFNNRFFTLFLVAIPAFGLFHPPFLRGVIVPFMHAIGAL